MGVINMEKCIILLACSKKYHNYCVAGIDAFNGEWIRIISEDEDIHNAVSIEDMQYKDGTIPSLFDIIKIQCKIHNPNYYQPENYVLDNSYYWEKHGEARLDDILRIHPPEDMEYIFFDNEKKVSSTYINTLHNLDKYSLTLISPSHVKIHVRQWYENEEKKVSASFDYNGKRYNYLGITDISCADYFKQKEEGDYQIFERLLFVISLGEAYDRDNCHYKLIATVINVY